MKIHEIVFKCYIIKKKDMYVSGCINLNLLCTGNAIKESKDKLIELMKDYLEVAIIGKNLKEAKHFLNRKVQSPLLIQYFLY